MNGTLGTMAALQLPSGFLVVFMYFEYYRGGPMLVSDFGMKKHQKTSWKLKRPLVPRVHPKIEEWILHHLANGENTQETPKKSDGIYEDRKF